MSFGRFGSLAALVQAPKPFLPVGSSALLMKKQAPGQNTAKGNNRINNAISYVSPAFGGITLHAMYSNGMSNDDAKWSGNHHYYGLGIKTTVGALGRFCYLLKQQMLKVTLNTQNQPLLHHSWC